MISRVKLSVRFDERNAHCQCVACNVFKHGNLIEYCNRFVERYGQEEFNSLLAKSKQTMKLSPEWYRERIAYYKARLVETNG